jgi:hypothetical protein
VESIIGRRRNASGALEYQVKWLGYTDTTWEPFSNLRVSDAVVRLVKEYNAKHPIRRKKRR